MMNNIKLKDVPWHKYMWGLGMYFLSLSALSKAMEESTRAMNELAEAWKRVNGS